MKLEIPNADVVLKASIAQSHCLSIEDRYLFEVIKEISTACQSGYDKIRMAFLSWNGELAEKLKKELNTKGYIAFVEKCDFSEAIILNVKWQKEESTYNEQTNI